MTGAAPDIRTIEHPSSRARSEVYPEIQGLRFIAVGAVVLYHLWPTRVTGGYVGVDVFFVISGFLITSHLLREMLDSGSVRLGRFYARRARRLLPASLLVLAVIAVSTWLLLPQRMWGQVFSEIIGATFYVENWVLAAASVDYLAQNTNIASPVQHYWSLSVEEQFYLVWPLLMLLAAFLVGRRTAASSATLRRGLFIALALVCLVSFVLSVVQTVRDPGPAYFATYTRAWEFAAGGLLAIGLRRSAGHSVARSIISWLGIAFILGTVLFYTAETAFPGYLAALPVLGTVLVIAAGDPENRWAPGVLLRRRPVQYLGDISYSTYLVHWPLIVFAPYLLARDVGGVDKLVILALTIVLAAASKHLVEDPARRTPFLAESGRRTLVSFAIVLAPTVIFSLVMTNVAAANIQRDQAQAAQLLAEATGNCPGAAALTHTDCELPPGVLIPSPDAAITDDVNTAECWSRNGDDTLRICSVGPESGPRVALVGDSHSNQYLAAMQRIAENHGWRVDVFGKTGCVWTDAVQQNAPSWVENCERWKDKLQMRLASTEPYDVIVTSYQATSPFESDGGDVEEVIVEGFVDAWTPVAVRGTRIVAILDNPRPRSDYLDCIEHNRDDPGGSCKVSQQQALNFFDGQPEAVERVPGAELLDLTDLFCDGGVCEPVIGNVIVYRDATHVTSTYAMTMAPAIYSRIVELTSMSDGR